MIQVTNCTLTIRNKRILNALSCSIEPGSITSFIGKSGAGKTTLLKSIVGLISIDSGMITINECEISTLSAEQRAREIGLVFQEFNLFPYLTVLENCLDPLIIQGQTHREAYNRSVEVLTALEIPELVSKYPHELSGGQQQRVAIARALCLKPSTLLLDEPTASLDPENSAILVSLLRTLTGQGLTIGLSSQDMNFVNAVADRIYFVENGEITEYCSDMSLITQFPKIEQFVS